MRGRLATAGPARGTRIELARRASKVARVLEELRHRDPRVPVQLPEIVQEVQAAGTLGAPPRHEGVARRRAVGELRVRRVKGERACGERVDIRRAHEALVESAELRPHVVGDEMQNVGRPRGGHYRRAGEEEGRGREPRSESPNFHTVFCQ